MIGNRKVFMGQARISKFYTVNELSLFFARKILPNCRGSISVSISIMLGHKGFYLMMDSWNYNKYNMIELKTNIELTYGLWTQLNSL